MKTQPFFKSSSYLKKSTVIIAAVALFFAMLSCNVGLTGSSNDSSIQTQVALGAQQTQLAAQSGDLSATLTAQQALINAQATAAAAQLLPPTPDYNATQIALSVQQTAAAQPVQPVIPTLPPPANPTAPPAVYPTVPPTAQPVANLSEQMKNAKILVYEDIVEDPGQTQYIKKTLDTMGLNYKWDGNAVGRLKSDMLAGAPGGVPWDLVILGIEYRGNVSGEYFDYLMDVINQGTAVIMEAWHLDAISQGTVSTILSRCGVDVREYTTDTGTLLDVVIWPISGASSHPVLTTPNSGMTFTKARDTWLWSGDLGDKQNLTGTGDAQFLLGTNASEKDHNGVLTVCMDGQLILQTFSSHSFGYQTMYPLWENYITNALKWRFEHP